MNGRSERLNRSTRKTGQTYSVSLDEETPYKPSQSVSVKVIRTVVPQWRPPSLLRSRSTTRDLSVHLDHSDTTIADLRVSDASGHRSSGSVTVCQTPYQA